MKAKQTLHKASTTCQHKRKNIDLNIKIRALQVNLLRKNTLKSKQANKANDQSSVS